MSEWNNFIAAIKLAKESLNLENGEECFFRGHADSRWSLLPTLLRHAKQENLTGLQLRRLEADLFFEFQARAKELHHHSLTDWDVLHFMRHHGVATRILDWTEVFGVALYFAVNDVPAKATPRIWLLNPYELNEHSQSWETRDLVSPHYLGGEDGWEYSDFMVDYDDLKFGWNHPVALYPVQRSARLHAQHGYFTIHGDVSEPLEKINPRVVRSVDIPRTLIPDAHEFLSMAGISIFSMFPDLDGLARELNRKNRIT